MQVATHGEPITLLIADDHGMILDVLSMYENGGAILVHGSGGIVLSRAA